MRCNEDKHFSQTIEQLSPTLVVSCVCWMFFRAKLHHNAAAVHVPIGLEGEHVGVVDVIHNKAVYFEGKLGSVHQMVQS